MHFSFIVQEFTVFFLWLTIPPWLAAFIFSFSYIKKRIVEFRIFFLLTFACNILLFFAHNWFTFLTIYETLTLCSLPLVFHERNQASVTGGKWYFFFSLLSGILIFGSIILEYANPIFLNHLVWLPLLFRVVGLLIKCGSFPFHVWLPEAHPVAPSPASAILSGSIIKIGFYGLIKLTNEYAIPAFFGTFLLWLSVVTMIYAVLYALLQSNIKKMLAFHSVSQMGYVLLGLAAYWIFHDEVALIGSLLHAMNHAYFKSALFITAGIQYLSYHSLNMYDIKGFFRRSPLLSLLFFIAALGISGAPFFNGYISKTFLHEELLLHPSRAFLWIESIFLLTAIGTFASNMKWFALTVFRKENIVVTLHKTGQFLVHFLPLLILSLFIFTIGVFPLVCEYFLPKAMHVPIHHLIEEVMPFHHLFTHSLEGFAYILLAGILLIYTGLRQNWFHYHLPGWIDVKTWWIFIWTKCLSPLFRSTQSLELIIVKLFSLISYSLVGSVTYDIFIEKKIAQLYQLCYVNPVRFCHMQSDFESHFQENLFSSVNPPLKEKNRNVYFNWFTLSDNSLLKSYKHFFEAVKYLLTISDRLDQQDSRYYEKITSQYGKIWIKWLLFVTLMLIIVFIFIFRKYFS